MASLILVVPGGPGFGTSYLHALRGLLPDQELVFCASSGPRMDDHVRQVEEARRASGAAVLLGHSFGGLVACHHALAFPGAAKGLILLEPDPATFSEWEGFRAHVVRKRRASDKAEMETLSSTPGWATQPRLVAAYFRAALAPYFADPQDAAGLDFEFSAESMARIQSQSQSVRADLSQWDLSGARSMTPALLVHGEESVFAPSSPETLARIFPNGESIVLPSVGHFPHLEAPGAVSALVARFLALHAFTP